jgi:hypothetical protein
MADLRLQLARKAFVVGAFAVAEKVRTPALRAGDVPISGEHITAEWLTTVLCRHVPGARVVRVSFPGGSSGTSERVSLRVAYNEAGDRAGLPTELFTKSTRSFVQRMVLGGAGFLAGETRFYTGLRQGSTIEAPLGYWGKTDDRSWRSIAITEDVAATKGAQFLSPTTGFTRDQISDIVQGLARLHAPYWGSPAIDGLQTPAEYCARTSALGFEKRAAVGMKRARHVLPPRLLGQADRLFAATVKSMHLATFEMGHTLLHGDAHAGQTYLINGGRLGLGDWQAIMRGGWAFDFAYMVNSACEPADRRRWVEELLVEYIDGLVAFGGPSLDFDEAMLAYRQQSFWPYTAWAFTIGRAFYHSHMQPVDACLAVMHRTATAIEDLDAFAALGM